MARYMAAHEAGWRNARHRQKWHNTLSTYAYLVIGRLPDDAVDTGLARQILEPLWGEKNETASRARPHRENPGLGEGQRRRHKPKDSRSSFRRCRSG